MIHHVITFITSEPITCFMVVASYNMHFHVIHFRCQNTFFRSSACITKLLLTGFIQTCVHEVCKCSINLSLDVHAKNIVIVKNDLSRKRFSYYCSKTKIHLTVRSISKTGPRIPKIKCKEHAQCHNLMPPCET